MPWSFPDQHVLFADPRQEYEFLQRLITGEHIKWPEDPAGPLILSGQAIRGRFSRRTPAHVRTNILEWAVAEEGFGQAVEHIVSQSPCDNDRQTAACELVKHDQHAEGTPTLPAILDEIIRPDLVRPFGPK